MKNIRNISLAFCAALMLGVTSCAEDFLDQPALGALSDDVIANEAGLEKLLIGAYAALDGVGFGGGSAWEKALITGYMAVLRVETPAKVALVAISQLLTLSPSLKQIPAMDSSIRNGEQDMKE